MREITNQELNYINGGEYQHWEVVTIAAASSGLAFATYKLVKTYDFLVAGKYLLGCSIPTALAAGIIVGAVELTSWYFSES